MILWCYILAGALGAIVILYGLLEIHYFLRMCLCVICARFCKRKTPILDTTLVTGICLTTDIDTLLYHMNNARYLREIDFARVDFYERTNLYQTICSKGGSVVQGATTIRYRRFIRPFSLFRLTSKIVYWDEQSIFMEHRFISPADGFIHCIALCRQRVINCSADEVIDTLLTSEKKNQLKNGGMEKLENGTTTVTASAVGSKPEIPLEVLKWMESNDISSANLRNDC